MLELIESVPPVVAIDDIMAACCLDRAEVELLKNLHTNN